MKKHILIKPAENGFIVTIDGKTHVFPTQSELIERVKLETNPSQSDADKNGTKP